MTTWHQRTSKGCQYELNILCVNAFCILEILKYKFKTCWSENFCAGELVSGAINFLEKAFIWGCDSRSIFTFQNSRKVVSKLTSCSFSDTYHWQTLRHNFLDQALLNVTHFNNLCNLYTWRIFLRLTLALMRRGLLLLLVFGRSL